MTRDRISSLDGVDVAALTFEDIRCRHRIFRCNSTGSGRDKKHIPWNAMQTNIGEFEIKIWCRLVEAVIEDKGEQQLLNNLIQWASEHNYTKDPAAKIREKALELHANRIFDNPQWVSFIPFNLRYRPEVLEKVDILVVSTACCVKPGEVTQAQIDQAYDGKIACPHCGRWSSFTILRRRLKPEPPNPCLDCDCYDPDMGCSMPGIDRSYACPQRFEDDGQTEGPNG